jgi:predicted aspartyl protease
MLKKIILLAITTIIYVQLPAQSKLPIIKATKKTVKIKDGDKMSGWNLSPEIKPDVFVASRTRLSKKVTFYTDTDSISFTVKPNQAIDFIILLNNKDTCYTQIQSAIQKTNSPTHIPFKTDTIPFALTSYNNISIQTVVNQADTLNLMFHSGVNSVYITKEGLAKTTRLKVDKSGQVQSWGGSANAAFSTTNTLQVGKFRKDNVEITIDERSGQGTDGKFGFSFFDNTILEVNYDKMQLIIHNKLPKSVKKYAKLPMTFSGSSFFLDTKIKLKGQTYQDKFMFHTGYAGNLILGTKFMDTYNLRGTLDTLGVEELRDSYSNVMKNITTNIASLQLGETHFSNIKGGVMDKKVQFPTNVLGNDILKRFNVFVDFQHDMIYLKPNSLMDMPFKT